MKDWKMPYVEVGMVIWWYSSGERREKPIAGIVTAVYPEMIAINRVENNSRYTVIVEGCRHIDDPRAKEAERIADGSWEHSNFTKAVLAFTQHMAKAQPPQAPQVAGKH